MAEPWGRQLSGLFCCLCTRTLFALLLGGVLVVLLGLAQRRAQLLDRHGGNLVQLQFAGFASECQLINLLIIQDQHFKQLGLISNALVKCVVNAAFENFTADCIKR